MHIIVIILNHNRPALSYIVLAYVLEIIGFGFGYQTPIIELENKKVFGYDTKTKQKSCFVIRGLIPGI